MTAVNTIELRRLRYFVAVGEELHFSRAAERLHMAQPALSQAIQTLEAELGVQLLTRSTRAVRLTDAGEVLLEEARLVLTQVVAAIERTRAAADGTLGTLSMGYSPLSRETASLLVGEFTSKHPSVRITHHTAYTVPLVEQVARGELDAALIVSQASTADLPSQPVRDVPWVCIVNPDHPLADRGSIAVAELEPYPIAIAKSPQWGRYLERLLDLHGVDANIVSIDDPVGMFPQVVLTRGSQLVWLQTMEYYPIPGSGVCVSFDPPFYCSFDIAWREDAGIRPITRRFIDVTRAISESRLWIVESARRPLAL